jgi:hypothetical protein
MAEPSGFKVIRKQKNIAEYEENSIIHCVNRYIGNTLCRRPLNEKLPCPPLLTTYIPDDNVRGQEGRQAAGLTKSCGAGGKGKQGKSATEKWSEKIF